jgi:uncharacterized protein
MKAVLALIIIYVGTFFVAIQGASQSSVQAASQNAAASQGQSGPAQAKPIDPAKEADIRSLLELIGVHDAAEEATTKGIEQYREALLSTVPDNERGKSFINAFIDGYQKKYNPDDMADELVVIYDRHFTEDDIKGLLQFYGSPLGQKMAAENGQLSAEIQITNKALGLRVAKSVLQDLRKQYPGIGAQARLQKARPGQTDQKQQAQANPVQP